MTSQQLDIQALQFTSMPITQIITELEREYQTRLRVYPEWIQSGRISRITAVQRLVAIRQAIQQLKNLLPPTPLFAQPK